MNILDWKKKSWWCQYRLNMKSTDLVITDLLQKRNWFVALCYIVKESQKYLLVIFQLTDRPSLQQGVLYCFKSYLKWQEKPWRPSQHFITQRKWRSPITCRQQNHVWLLSLQECAGEKRLITAPVERGPQRCPSEHQAKPVTELPGFQNQNSSSKANLCASAAWSIHMGTMSHQWKQRSSFYVGIIIWIEPQN